MSRGEGSGKACREPGVGLKVEALRKTQNDGSIMPLTLLQIRKIYITRVVSERERERERERENSTLTLLFHFQGQFSHKYIIVRNHFGQPFAAGK